jgi:pilus assembly protein CpaC
VKSHTFSCKHKSQSHLAGMGTAIVAAASLLMVLPSAVFAQDGLVPPMARASIIDAASAPGVFASISRAAMDSKMLHVIVGHALFIDTKTRLRRVYVADPAVINSVTLTPTEIIVTAMSPGISSLTLLDEAGQAQSYVVSSDIDIDGLRRAMTDQMRGNAVKVEGAGGRVTLSGIVASDTISDSAFKLASMYSKEVTNTLTVTPSHPKQVRLQVRILEVDRSKALQLGINLFNPGGNTSILAAATTSQYPSTMSFLQSAVGNVGGGLLTTSNPLSFMLYSAKLNLGATIQDLEAKQVLQVLAEPTITTISGVKADFLSGGEFPFPMVQPGSGSNSSPVVTISFRPYGVKVEFTPIVNEDGTIRLKVMPEVSALDYTNAVTISGFTVPALSTRRASTEVELRSEQSFAISGLLDQRTTDIMNKNPGAASIPILGYLFKSKNTVRSTTELIIVVTPTVVDPLVEMAVPSQPDLPVTPLNIEKYDQGLGKNHNPQPAPPSITPDHPPTVPPVFPRSTPVKPPTAIAALVVTPPPTPQNIGHAASSRPATSVETTRGALPAPAQLPPTAPTAPAVSMRTDPAIATNVAITTPGSAVQTSSPDQTTEPSMIEIMTVSHESDAEAMVAALNRRGYNVAVSHDAQTSLLHLDIGPFANTKDAETMRQRLLLDGYDATIK